MLASGPGGRCRAAFLGICRWLAGPLCAAALFAIGTCHAAESIWAHPGYTGRMIYTPDVEGDRISDFSIVGYGQGKTAIPDVPVAVTVYADSDSDDDTARLQAAIDQVAAMPLVNGVRGAVLLTAGSYEIASQLKINASGVVLRGEGQGDTGTILHATGTSTREEVYRAGGLICIDGTGSNTLSGSTYSIIDKKVPAGTNSFRVNSTSGLSVGNTITITRPATDAWIAAVGMGASYLGDDAWTTSDMGLTWERTITRIEGNRVFLDSPITTAIEKAEFGINATFKKSTFSGRISNVGVENLRAESDYASDTDEAHCWDFVDVYRAENAWVRNTTARYFADSHVQIDRYAKNVTVTDCTSEMPKSQITAGRRYTYDIHGQQSLVANCLASDGRHDFVSANQVTGPNVFFNCRAINAHAESGRTKIGPTVCCSITPRFKAMNSTSKSARPMAPDGLGQTWCCGTARPRATEYKILPRPRIG